MPSEVATEPSQPSQSTFDNVFLNKITEKPQTSASSLEIEDSYGTPVAVPSTTYLPGSGVQAKGQTTLRPVKKQPTYNPEIKSSNSAQGKKAGNTELNKNKSKLSSESLQKSKTSHLPEKTSVTKANSETNNHEELPSISNPTPETSHSPKRPENLQRTEDSTGLYDWPITSDPTIIDFTKDHKHPTIRNV